MMREDRRTSFRVVQCLFLLLGLPLTLRAGMRTDFTGDPGGGGGPAGDGWP